MAEDIKAEAIKLWEERFSVVPTCPNEKYPSIAWAPYADKQCSREQIDEWWPPDSEAGLAIVTGVTSNDIVLDYDPNLDCDVQDLILEAMEYFGKEFPKTCRVITAGGGHHEHYKVNGEVVKTGIFFKGECGKIEIRGEKSIAMMPPSKAKSKRLGDRVGDYNYHYGMNKRISWHDTWMAESYRGIQKAQNPSDENIPPEPSASELLEMLQKYKNQLTSVAKAILNGEPTDDRSKQIYNFGCEVVRSGIEDRYIIACLIAAVPSHGDKYERRRDKWEHPWHLAGLVLQEADRPDNETSSEWELPVPFYDFSVPPFPSSKLPDMLRDFVEAESEATQTPADLAGMLAISVCSGAVAGRVKVQVRSGWVEPVNTFTVTVLPPGSRKSANFTDITEPILEFEEELVTEIAPIVDEAQTKKKILEQAKHKAEKEAADAVGEEREELIRKATELGKEILQHKVPLIPRLWADDCSPEKLVGLLRDQEGRIAILSPEGGIFDIMAGRYSNSGPNLDVYLKGHSGDDIRVDRVGRPSEYVKNPALTLGLAVQPDVIRGLIHKPGLHGRGLLARFLYAFPNSNIGHRKTNATPVPSHISKTYKEDVKKLLKLSYRIGKEKGKSYHLLKLSPEATEVFNEFEAKLEPRLSKFNDLGNIQDWGGKLAGAIVRLAGIFHMCVHVNSQNPWDSLISADTMNRAIGFKDYLIAHAKIAFAEMGVDQDIDAARYFLDLIKSKNLTEFTRKVLFEHVRGKTRFQKAVSLDSGIKQLIEHGYIREITQEKKGAGRPPSPKYEVNPLLKKSVKYAKKNSTFKVNFMKVEQGC